MVIGLASEAVDSTSQGSGHHAVMPLRLPHRLTARSTPSDTPVTPTPGIEAGQFGITDRPRGRHHAVMVDGRAPPIDSSLADGSGIMP